MGTASTSPGVDAGWRLCCPEYSLHAVYDALFARGLQRSDAAVHAAIEVGNKALDRARSVQGRLSSGIAERAPRRRGGKEEERDEQG